MKISDIVDAKVELAFKLLQSEEKITSIRLVNYEGADELPYTGLLCSDSFYQVIIGCEYANAGDFISINGYEVYPCFGDYSLDNYVPNPNSISDRHEHYPEYLKKYLAIRVATTQEADDLSYTMEWKTVECGSENCWCRMIETVTPIVVAMENYDDEFYVVPAGSVDTRLADYIVSLHNNNVDI